MFFLATSAFPALLRTIGIFGRGAQAASTVLSLIAIALTGTAAVLLLLPESNEWFRTMSSPAGRVGLPLPDGNSETWFYMDGKDQVGPIAEGDLRGMLRMGDLDLETLVWTDGMPDWEQAGLALPKFGKQGASD